MGRAPCCDKSKVKKGPWSKEEDNKLKEYIEKNGTGGNWIALPQKAGLKRCGKSCRLRWLNYLRPNIKHGAFSDDEDRIICTLYATIGSRWSIIAAQLPGRTDNDIKNYWNTKLKKKLLGIHPSQRKLNQQKQYHQQQQQQQQLEQQIFPSSLPISSSRCPEAIQLPTLCIQPDLMSHNQSSLLKFGSHHCEPIGCRSSELEFGVRDDMGFDTYIYGGLEESQKLLFSDGGGELADQILQYGSYEDIKHLVSTNSISSSNLHLDQHYPTSASISLIKTQERALYSYHMNV